MFKQTPKKQFYNCKAAHIITNVFSHFSVPALCSGDSLNKEIGSIFYSSIKSLHFYYHDNLTITLLYWSYRGLFILKFMSYHVKISQLSSHTIFLITDFVAETFLLESCHHSGTGKL